MRPYELLVLFKDPSTPKCVMFYVYTPSTSDQDYTDVTTSDGRERVATSRWHHNTNTI